MDPLLERGEVEVSVIPHHELAVEHRVGGELTDGVDDLREVPAKGPLLARLQRHPPPAAEGQAAETVELRLKRPATRPVQGKLIGGDRDHGAQRELDAGEARLLSHARR
jgi:hypothetical protein